MKPLYIMEDIQKYFLPLYVEREGDELPLCGWNIYSCEVIK